MKNVISHKKFRKTIIIHHELSFPTINHNNPPWNLSPEVSWTINSCQTRSSTARNALVPAVDPATDAFAPSAPWRMSVVMAVVIWCLCRDVVVIDLWCSMVIFCFFDFYVHFFIHKCQYIYYIVYIILYVLIYICSFMVFHGDSWRAGSCPQPSNSHG